MVDSTFLSTYKGSLYPVPLSTTDKSNFSFNADGPSCLVDLCCDQIIKDSSWTLKSLETLPSCVYYNLMRAALASSKDRAIEVNIATSELLQLAILNM